MLKEVTNVRQIEGEPFRRWFSDPQLDLFVWYDEQDEILRFQLCYDKGAGERALIWCRDNGFSHHGVDDGEGGIYEMKSTPILVADGVADTARIDAQFNERGQKLEHDLYEFVSTRIREYE